MVSEVDEYVGRVLDAVIQSGQLDNTLFVYTSDHGEMGGDHGLWLKNVLLENAARVPLLMAGAGLAQGKVVEAPVSHVDMVATMLELAGAAAEGKLRGHSLVPLSNGRPGSHPGFAYSESHSEGNCTGSFMVRKGDWKYLHFTGDQPLLFNLKDDPGEFNNLAGKPEAASIRKELHAHLTSLVDPDAVTERSFVAQERRLKELVGQMTPERFYQELVGRLGPAQARVITNRCYRKPT
jgi:choline-sulfatase